MTETTTTIKDLLSSSGDLSARISAAEKVFDIPAKQEKITELEAQSQQDGFWDDAQKAGSIMREVESLKKSVAHFSETQERIADAQEMLADAADEDVAMYAAEIAELAQHVEQIETEMLLSEKYDSHDAIITIYAGAGGTDAQDWAEMLFRMFGRWAERREFGFTVLDEARGAEAGYKSITCEITGANAYGLLRVESGTHRLVRLSPFNSDSLRQTSFARVEVIPVLDASDNTVEINPADLRVDTFRSSGAGGQSVNTTDSAVRITHIPTNTVATCQNERSQLQNKEQAMKILTAKLVQKKLEEEAKAKAALRGENISAEWGSQIRSYVLHPYKMVKDHRTKYESAQTQDVLDGDLDAFIEAGLRWHASR